MFGSDWLTEFCLLEGATGGGGAWRFLRGGFAGGPARTDCDFCSVAAVGWTLVTLLLDDDVDLVKGIVANMLFGRVLLFSDSVGEGALSGYDILPCQTQNRMFFYMMAITGVQGPQVLLFH